MTPGASPQALLDVRALSKAFGGLRAVDAVSLAVHEGEILGLLGPNGSGKTTLFNLIAGDLAPDAGEIYFAGRPITRYAPSRRAALGIVRTFQLVRALLNLTVLDNVLVARLYGREPAPSVSRARAEARRCLEIAGLDDRAGRPAARLPLADRKKLEIASALAARPRLLLLDEPAAGLDQREVDALLSLVRGARAEGITLMIVEHNMRVVHALCDRVVVLSAGRAIAEGTPARVLEHAAVVEVYLGRGDPPVRPLTGPR